MAVGQCLFGKSPFGRSTFGWYQEPPIFRSITTDQVYEIRATINDQIVPLNDIIEGKWKRSLKENSELDFTVPFSLTYKEALQFPAHLLLYRRGVLQETFIITSRKITRSINGETLISVHADGIIAKLAYAEFSTYNTADYGRDDGTRKLWQVVADLMGFQPTVRPFIPSVQFVLDNIDGQIRYEYITFQAENQSILEALKTLQNQYGGRVFVNASNELVWRTDLMWENYAVFRTEKNLLGIELEEDFRSIRTRVIASGRQETRDSDEYLNMAEITAQADAPSSQTQKYGTITEYVSNVRIRTSTELNARAQQRVKSLAYPIQSVRCDIVDLNALYPTTSIPDVGAPVRIVDPFTEIDVLAYIDAIEFDLIHPLDTKIELGIFKAPDWITEQVKRAMDLNRDNAVVPQKILDELKRAIAEMGVPPFGIDIQSCGIANFAGTKNEMARVDHIHKVAWV